MHLSLRSIQDLHEHVEQRYARSLFPGAEGDPFRVVSPVALVFDVDRQDVGRYRVNGHLSSELELTCSRCLEPFTLPVTTSFDLRYVPRTQNVGEGEQEVEEDDLTTAFYSDDRIDLGELITEQFQLALPMKPLCSDDCRGLCPQCGTNLNTGSCNCDRQWVDPRLAALKDFIKGPQN
jgi:uncharacterized protein